MEGLFITFQDLIIFCQEHLHDEEGQLCEDGPCPYIKVCAMNCKKFNGGLAKYGLTADAGVTSEDFADNEGEPFNDN